VEREFPATPFSPVRIFPAIYDALFFAFINNSSAGQKERSRDTSPLHLSFSRSLVANAG